MKIIFDSEEQKKKFLSWCSSFVCPADMDINDKDYDDCGDNYGCEECWKNCGIGMEVVDKFNSIGNVNPIFPEELRVVLEKESED